MTEYQKEIYMLLLMAGRKEEAEEYRAKYLHKPDLSSHRYVTQGVHKNIPLHLIEMMWDMVDRMDIEEKDYLQIFELSTISESIQVMEHHQEEPEYYSPRIYIPYGPFCSGKVYIIDDGEANVMCLPEER